MNWYKISQNVKQTPLPNGGVIKENAAGEKHWFLHGLKHREDGPAVIYPNGTKEWYLNGKRHREDGPASIYPNGTKYWFLNGLTHREDGPAIEKPDGTKYWFLNGKRHREDGPAIIYPNGTKYWFLHDLKHREDGPAIEFAGGTKEWYLNGKELTRNECAKKIQETYKEKLQNNDLDLDALIEMLKIKNPYISEEVSEQTIDNLFKSENTRNKLLNKLPKSFFDHIGMSPQYREIVENHFKSPTQHNPLQSLFSKKKSWYKKANREVRPEYWQSVGKWVLLPSENPIDRNLRPLGKPTELGIGKDIFEFETKEEAEIFATKQGWTIK